MPFSWTPWHYSFPLTLGQAFVVSFGSSYSYTVYLFLWSHIPLIYLPCWLLCIIQISAQCNLLIKVFHEQQLKSVPLSPCPPKVSISSMHFIAHTIIWNLSCLFFFLFFSLHPPIPWPISNLYVSWKQGLTSCLILYLQHWAQCLVHSRHPVNVDWIKEC